MLSSTAFSLSIIIISVFKLLHDEKVTPLNNVPAEFYFGGRTLGSWFPGGNIIWGVNIILAVFRGFGEQVSGVGLASWHAPIALSQRRGQGRCAKSERSR